MDSGGDRATPRHRGMGVLSGTGSIRTIWPMFGIANQHAGRFELAIITTLISNPAAAVCHRSPLAELVCHHRRRLTEEEPQLIGVQVTLST